MLIFKLLMMLFINLVVMFLVLGVFKLSILGFGFLFFLVSVFGVDMFKVFLFGFFFYMCVLLEGFFIFKGMLFVLSFLKVNMVILFF